MGDAATWKRRSHVAAAWALLAAPAVASVVHAAPARPLLPFDRRDHIRAPQVDHVRAADVDGDGDLDFVSLEPAADDISWWENVTGRGDDFVEHEISLASGGARGLALGDAEGDGDVDAFALDPEAGRITLWRNDGAGAFERDPRFVETARNATFIAAADAGGDGTTDLFVLEAGTRRIAWWPDAAGPDADAGARRNIVTLPPGIGGESIGLDDVDGDGRVDILTADRDTDRIGLWRQVDGPGGRPDWEAAWPGLGLREESVIAVRAGDADGDGDADLFALRRAPYVVTLWTQEADGSFTRDRDALARSPGADLAFPWNAIDLGDVNGDGALDFVTSERDGFLCWYENPLENPPTPRATATRRPTATPTTGPTATPTPRGGTAPTPGGATATPHDATPATTPGPVVSRLAIPFAERGN